MSSHRRRRRYCQRAESLHHPTRSPHRRCHPCHPHYRPYRGWELSRRPHCHRSRPVTPCLRHQHHRHRQSKMSVGWPRPNTIQDSRHHPCIRVPIRSVRMMEMSNWMRTGRSCQRLIDYNAGELNKLGCLFYAKCYRRGIFVGTHAAAMVDRF